jgi:hypothetical protein
MTELIKSTVEKIKCIQHDQYYVKTSDNKGCSICKIEKSKTKKVKSKRWSYTTWRDDGISSSNFDSFKIYVIKCWDEKEVFYKIGKTFNTIEKRFNDKIKLPYNYEIVLMFSNSALYISRLEKRLQKESKEHKYKPQKNFTGKNECFSAIKMTDGFNKLKRIYDKTLE